MDREDVRRAAVASRSRGEKGCVRALLGKMSGLSVPQITRLIRQYRLHGTIARKPVWRRRFPTQYTSVEVTLLAQVDRVHRIKAMGTARKASIPSTPSLLNSVAAVTQWENIGCTAKISEIYLMPVVKAQNAKRNWCNPASRRANRGLKYRPPFPRSQKGAFHLRLQDHLVLESSYPPGSFLD